MDRPTNRLVYKINPTAVTGENDQVDAWSDGYGRQRVIVDSGAITANVDTSLLAKDSSVTAIGAKLGTLGQQNMAGSAPVVIASNQSPIAIKGTVTSRAALVASSGSPNTLPAAGAYEAAPSDGSCTAIPAGSRRATIYISYTRGAANGQAAHKLYVSNGTEVAQCMSIDGTYNGINGAPSTSSSAILYTIPVDLIGGETKIGMASAEVGVTGTPGTYYATVTFG